MNQRLSAVVHAIRVSRLTALQRSSLSGLVSEERRSRMARFVRQEDADRCLLAGLLIRYGAERLFGIRHEEMTLSTNTYGKPSFARYPDIFFNAAHSGDWVVCAWDSAPIGVDVEQLQEIDLSIADRFFSRPECAMLEEQPEAQRLELFYQLWALKESFIKQVGKGLSIPLDAFAILPKPGGIELTVLQPSAQAQGPLSFRLYELQADGERYAAALCATHDAMPDAMTVVELEQLVACFT
ncbi:4'-phosphopantetheinyl transferase superfamily protein [Paenibacillus sp. YYML68]|uniref:4'-phosphopantetheinyl transferase family protein n=1 Tax=Paenibacillus sp. YYML68 TaxID=2909250 RepID=UPI00248FAF49|nr:4'-phosphopantetheinyl transferase superfamily protein [Paenibacillus sp. YYML68]